MHSINQRLIIVDPSLKTEEGHHYALSKTISDEAIKQGMKVIWITHQGMCDLDEKLIEIWPVFSASMYEKVSNNSNKTLVDVKLINRIPVFLHPLLIRLRDSIKKYIPNKYKTLLLGIDADANGAKGFSNELTDCLIKLNANAEDMILVHSADGIIYRGVLNVFLNYPASLQLPIFHLCSSYDDKIMPQYNQGLSADRVIKYYKYLGLLGNKIYLYGENKWLSQYLQQIWQVPVQRLELPPVNHLKSAATENLSLTDKLHVVYLGAAREEKGFHLLPDIVRKTLGNCPDISFTIQCSPQIIGYTNKIKRIISELKQFPESKIRLIETNQSMNTYYELLESADIVLLCYQQENYQYRGSGIAVEAVSTGKIIIATPGTFPAKLAGDAAVLARNANEVAEQILKIHANKAAFKERAAKRMTKYCEDNSPERYINRLLSNTASEKPIAGVQEEIYKNANILSLDNLNIKRLIKFN